MSVTLPVQKVSYIYIYIYIYIPSPLQIHGHVLCLEVLLDSLRTAFATEARLLDASKGSGRVGDHALVEADHPGLELLDHAKRPLQVAGVEVGDQAELGVVRRGDRLVLAREALDRGDRSEDLLL